MRSINAKGRNPRVQQIKRNQDWFENGKPVSKNRYINPGWHFEAIIDKFYTDPTLIGVQKKTGLGRSLQYTAVLLKHTLPQII